MKNKNLEKEQEIPITKYDRIWLEHLYKVISENKRPSYRTLRATLYDLLPREYNPENIDVRLARYRGQEITLLGVDLIDPKFNVFVKANKVIRAIRHLLIDNPEKNQVTADELVEIVKMSKGDVSFVLSLISQYGSFWSSASGDAQYVNGYNSITFQDNNAIFDEYLYFTDIRELIKKYQSKSQAHRTASKENFTTEREPKQEAKQHSIFRSKIDLVDKNLCFVLMPFKEDWSNEIYKLIKKTIESMGLQCLRADNLNGPIIIEDIWTKINQAGLIIADVTNKNANVMYEVGIAHTLDRPTLLLTQNIKEVPFDFTHLRHIEYRNSVSGSDQLKENLKTAITDFLKPVKNPHTLSKMVNVKGSSLTNKVMGVQRIFKNR